MKYTLLDMTQTILSSMDGEEINSINDNVEAQQVVKVIKTVYNDIVSRSGATAHKGMFNLTASGDNTKPVIMYKPTSIINIDWLKYNRYVLGDTDPDWYQLDYQPLEDFMHFSQQRKPSESDVETLTVSVDGFQLTFNYNNNNGPRYYTTLDDYTLLFDSYDSTVDSTLQATKTIGYGTKDMTFTEVDGFIPNLQSDQFSLLLNEAKSLAWIELKQSAHPKAEKTAKDNWVHLSRSRHNVPGSPRVEDRNFLYNVPNYGRK